MRIEAITVSLLLWVMFAMPASSAPAPLAVDTVEIPYSWSGNENFTTERFEATGQWTITLGAWCHFGVGYVRVIVFDHTGKKIAELTVIGEGTQTLFLDTEHELYFLEVSSPDMYVYHWELLVKSIETE